MEANQSTKTEEKLSEGSTSEKGRPIQPKLLEILNVPLISDKIIANLTLADMKAASETSVDFCRVIRGSSRFHKDAVLILSNKKYPWETVFRFTSVSQFPWGRVRIVVDDFLPIVLRQLPTESAVGFNNVLRSCELLTVVESDTFLRHTAFTAVILIDILKSAPHLTQLQIDTQLLKSTFSEDIASTDLSSLLQNLRILDVLEWNKSVNSFTNSYARVVIKEPTKRTSTSPEGFQHIQNLLQLTHSANKLTSLRLANISTCGTDDFLSRHGRSRHICHSAAVRMFISPLLMNSRETLTELTLFDDGWLLYPLTLNFPQLKKLTAGVTHVGQKEDLAEFVFRHKTLEELKLYETGFESERLLLEAVKQRRTLKKLHLILSSVDRETAAELDWRNLLESLTQLKDLSLSIWGLRNAWKGKWSLESFPRDRLERLSLDGVGGKEGFWKGVGGIRRGRNRWNLPLLDEDIVQVEDLPAPDIHDKQEVFMRFACLRRLRISQCLDALDDELLKFILQEFIHLEELEVSSCGKITHEGFIERDVRGNITKSPKALTHLTIDMPWRNTNKNLGLLLHSISFHALRYLHFRDRNSKIPVEFLVDLIKQNPSLETFAGRFQNSEVANVVLHTLKKASRGRLQKVILLEVE